MCLGVPVNEQPDAAERFRKKSSIPSHLDVTGLEDFTVQQYPRVPHLARIGFTFLKSTKRRQLLPVTGTSVTELRSQLQRSQLFIRPKRDLYSMVC